MSDLAAVAIESLLVASAQVEIVDEIFVDNDDNDGRRIMKGTRVLSTRRRRVLTRSHLLVGKTFSKTLITCASLFKLTK